MSDNKTQYYNDLNTVDSKTLYNQLPEYTRIARYAQYNKNKKRRETWEEQTNRVFNMHKVKFAKYLDNEKFIEYFNFAKLHVLNKDVLGSQRALQFGGPSILNKNTRIYNCAATYIDRVKAFQEVMFTLLCGVGIGFSVQTHHISKLPNIKNTQDIQKIYQIPDSIEGWSDAIAILASSYFTDNQPFPDYFNYDISFDFSLIRPAGSNISNIGGKAPGPDGLKSALQKIKEVFINCINQGFDKLRPIDAYDIIVHSSDAVLSGGVRRCIGKGSLVLTLNESFKPIENIQKGDFVSTNDGWKEVTNTFVQGKQKTIKITHSNGELICTPNHRVAVLKDNNLGFEWKEAGKLTFYDKLLYVEPKIDDAHKVNILPDFPNIIIPTFDTEIAWLLGNIQSNQKGFYNYISVYEKNNKEEQLNFIKKQLEKFDINYTNNQKLSTFFGLLLKNNVPNCVLKSTNSIKFAYIQGILDSNNNDYLKPEFLKDVQNLLYSLGIVSHFENNCIKNLIISNCHINKLNKGCSFGWTKIHDTNSYIENIFIPINIPISIKSIEQYEQVETYDIEVEGNHNFMCEGVLVHNSATLCLFSLEDTEMIGAKTGDWYIKNPQRARSNNSVLLLRDNTPEEKYMNLITSVKQFGEPGIIWADNTETLYNPCVEISLYGYDKDGNSGIQMCNLSEINMSSVNTETDFYARCKAASILGTFQAAYTDFGYLGKITQDIVEREALIGVSMTGMMENPLMAFNPEILEKGAIIVKNINQELSKIIGINKASRTTCIKPSGSTSCILGSSSGIHPCHADRYFRRVQSNNLEETLKFFKKYNPQAVETSVWSSGKTDDVITFLCKSKPGSLTKVDVSAIDLLEKVKLVQKHWVTTGRNLDVCVQPWLNHNVSNTITIKDNEWDLAAKFIYDNRHFFAGISMLGDSGDMTYHQAPFQAVYTHEMIAKMYGAGSVFASGLIVHANDSFNNNLYSACATLLGYGENLKMPDLNEDSKVSLVDSDKIYKKIRWIAQAKKFSKRHFNSDDLKMTYCLKAVDAWKTWCDLKRTYKPVPWEEFIEEDDNTKPTEYVACSGNSCEIIKF